MAGRENMGEGPPCTLLKGYLLFAAPNGCSDDARSGCLLQRASTPGLLSPVHLE
jgi:hypothetical protein